MPSSAKLTLKTAVELHPIDLENSFTPMVSKFPLEVVDMVFIVTVGIKRFVFTRGKE